MLLTRLGLGIGEAPFAPVTYRSVRAWAPYIERGTAIGAISAGSSLGLALGAPFVAWLIEVASWRWSFIITGAIGFGWVALCAALVSTPEKTPWLPQAERQRIFAERDAGIEPPSHGGVGYLGLIRCPAMWGLFVSQGCLVYSVYLYMTWLPNYLQTARGLSLVGSGIFTAIPFFAASVVNIIANWSGDRLLSAEGVRSGKRRYLVALSPVADGRRVGHSIRRIVSGGRHSRLDRSLVRQCRPRCQWRARRGPLALASRCRPGVRVPGTRRQQLRPARADRDRLSRRGDWKL
jgi:ACS family glucarate transporter-like MFS transporter